MPAETTAQFTPGPWHIREPRGSWNIHIDGPDGKYICQLPTWTDIRTTQECEANAQLILNAPRLLKTALDLWHANAAEGSDRDELLVASAWAELIDAIEAADGSRLLDPDEPTVEDLKERFA